MNIITTKQLTKKFGDFVAVDKVSFEVKKGEIFGFLGPNGAGKSTTINMLSTLLTPSSGEATINGFNVRSDRNKVRSSIGLVFQDSSLDDRLTAEENLRFHAKLYGVPKKDYQKRLKEVLHLVDLWDRKKDIVKIFSGGMKRRLEIARGLIHYPALLFLDEPTLGLDPQTRVHLWDYILQLKKEKEMTIFMTTHYMQEAEYCDRIAIIDHGKLVALDTPEGLKKKVGGDIITIDSSHIKNLKEELAKKYPKYKVKHKHHSLQIEVPEGQTVMPKLLKELDTQIDAVSLRKPTLDDVFLSITGRSIRADEASKKDTLRADMQRRSRF